MKKLWPYIAASIGFIITVIIIVVILDSIVFPALIHDKEKVKVPDLVGKSITEAERIIFDNGLTIGKLSEQFNEKIPQGIIISQIPNPGAEVKEGRAIHLSVSKGKEMVRVPYVIGQNLRSARLTLRNAGLEVGEITYDFNEIYGRDTVAKQSVSSGRNVPYGTTVDLTVSKGSENQVLVPKIVGKTLDEAKIILEESGLVLGTVSSQFHETYLSNTVIEQFPAAGSLVKIGDTIDIIVSK
jgi:serine/threonine-protein kinase